jgi:hypothetical protein
MIVLYLISLGSTVALLGVILILSFTGSGSVGGVWRRRATESEAGERLRLFTMDDQEIAIDNANRNSHLKWSAMLHQQFIRIAKSDSSICWM